jgi:quinol-cytochrome oxidoreductase complex cytochrome b subunit
VALHSAVQAKKPGGFGEAVIKTADWIKTRINNIDIFDEHYTNEAKTNPFYALGPIFYLVWMIVIATGCILIIWYIPTKAAAFSSILNIQDKIPFGGLIRGMHKYGADAMIIAATMRLYRMFLMADYKPGKELNIAIGLVTLLLSMYSGLTGYLLIWNQRAFWATKVFATFPTYMDQFPVMGDFYQPLVKSMHMGWNTAEVLLGGGAAITQETITRFFSLHLAFTLIPLIFVELYFYKNAIPRMPIGWVKRSVVIFMIAFVAVILPAAQGHRSDPDVTPLPILSDWYFLGLYQMYKYLEPVVATEITMLIPLTVIALPFIESWITGPEKDLAKRPLIFMITIMGALCWIVFSFLIIFNIANIHNDPPYWRIFLYLMVDAGLLMQMAVMWNNPDLQARVRQANGALIMAGVGVVQTIVGIVYYFMAKTEMFLSPITQAWTYGALRVFLGDNAQKAEALVRQFLPLNKEPVNKDYWDFHTLLDPAQVKLNGDPAGKALLEQLGQLCQQPTPIDWFFKLIPTFEPAQKVIVDHPHSIYLGLIDYLVNNRWCFDYVTFVDRMTPGLVKVTGMENFYPIEVPPLDMIWIWAGPVVVLAGILTWWHCKQSAQAKPVQAQPAVSGT